MKKYQLKSYGEVASRIANNDLYNWERDTPPEQLLSRWQRAIERSERDIKELETLSDPINWSPERDTIAPGRLTAFNRKKEPKQVLQQLYRKMRGNGYIDEAGDLITQDDHIWFKSPSTNALFNNLVREGILQHDQRSNVYIMPAAVVKRVDPYYKVYNQAFKEAIDDHAPNDLEHKQTRREIGSIANLKMLKNLGKSTNRETAFNEILDFLDDHYRAIQMGTRQSHRAANQIANHRTEIGSLNEMRDIGQRITAAERAEARRREREDMANNFTDDEIYNTLLEADWSQGHYDEDEATANGVTWDDPDAMDNYWQDDGWTDDDGNYHSEEEARNYALDRLTDARLQSPYEYSDDIRSIIGETWRLPSSPRDLTKRSEEHEICVGNINMPYINAVRNKTRLILLTDEATAEIQLTTNEDDIITNAIINQVKGIRNANIPIDKELKRIAKDLIGKNVNDVKEDFEDPQLETDVSDIIMKHILRPISGAIVNASKYG